MFWSVRLIRHLRTAHYLWPLELSCKRKSTFWCRICQRIFILHHHDVSKKEYIREKK